MICILKFTKGHNFIKTAGGVTVLFLYVPSLVKLSQRVSGSQT